MHAFRILIACMSSSDGNCNLFFNLQQVDYEMQIFNAAFLFKGLFKCYIAVKAILVKSCNEIFRWWSARLLQLLNIKTFSI